jgi:predicted metal-dependent hydrolase
MEYRLIRSRRRTLAICIEKDGSVTVRAPLHMAKSTVEGFVAEKADWIKEKSALMSAREAQRKDFRIGEGTTLPLLGREYPVMLGNSVAFGGSCFTVCEGNFDTLRPQLIALYRSLAGEFIPERVSHFSELTGWTPSGVRIGAANTSWGSCSGKNSLNFTWKLIMAPPELVDYVVVHELAHTVEHNHSARFWKLVESVLPDYKQRRAQLRTLAKTLQNKGF